MDKKIEDIGEFGLIDIIRKYADNTGDIYGIGDDCAIIPFEEKELLVTTDALVKNVHFYENNDPYKLGRKSLAVNISDVCAMAAEPKWAFLSLSIEPGTKVDYIDKFINGFVEMAEEYNIKLLGGDTTKTSVFTINVMLIGINKRNKSIKRSGAHIGEDVYVTGRIGCSYAGLRAIGAADEDKYHNLIEHHINPVPRCDIAVQIRELATAMIDISDGLIQDCRHICEESGIGMDINFYEVPFCHTDIVSKQEMLSGGEDYELAFCAKKEDREKVEKIKGVKRIGKTISKKGVFIIKNSHLMNLAKSGFKHF